jgi:hypothetical protein
MSGLLREKFAVGKVPELRAAYSSSEKAPWLGLALPENGKNPYQTLLHASPEDVRLVMVGGIATYGDPDLMSQLLPKRQLETLTVCGTTKALYIEPQDGVPQTKKSLKQMSTELDAKLAQWGTSLAELAPCHGSNQN